MEDLPYIDEHAVRTTASPVFLWIALIDSLANVPAGGAMLLYARAVGCDPARRSPEFAGRVGDTIPGFRVVESEPDRRLALAGQHRFARYQLNFEIGDGELSAKTYGEFPGLRGRLYRAAVIGTGGHRLITRGMLRKIARRAEQ